MNHTENDQGGARVRFPPPMVYLAWLGLGLLAQRVWPYDAFTGTRSRALSAATIGLVALALLTSTLSLFKRSGQNPAPWTPSEKLIARGPYRYSRNPMYVGMALLQVALGIVVDNIWVVVFAAPALAIIHFIAVVPEEAYLAVRLGEPYLRYKARVRRYL
jgi:protein-S-isoprenylcysteine O-methyltransferase Ste14